MLRSALLQRSEEAREVRQAAHEAWAVARKAQADLEAAQRGPSAWLAKLLGRLEARLSALRLASEVAQATFEQIEARRIALDEELNSTKLALVPLEDAPQRLTEARQAAQQRLLAEGHPTLAERLQQLEASEAKIDELRELLRLGRAARTELSSAETALAVDPALYPEHLILSSRRMGSHDREALSWKLTRAQAALTEFTSATEAPHVQLTEGSVPIGGLVLPELVRFVAARENHDSIRQAMEAIEPTLARLEAALGEAIAHAAEQRSNLDVLLLAASGSGPDELNTFPRFSSFRGD